ncbi:MAG: hypothetical protein CL489_11830 [Acidobacteria bacterium]|nr:hypothetical protein [Acidobacteriota bacterium]|tara:strand:- start:72 stop:713 length:642 start_codon:yes stop_codon:yes gene_type:complete
MREMTVQVWKIDDEDIPDDVKERAIENIRNNKSDDHWYAEDEGMTGVECLMGFPKYWNIGYTQGGNYIQFEFEDIKNGGMYIVSESVRQWLDIPSSTWNKFDTEIVNYENCNTTIRFMCDGENLLEIAGNTILPDRRWNLKPFIETEFSEEGENRIYYWDIEIMRKAKEKFDDTMDKALDNLVKSYEYSISDECCIEDAIANEWEFDNSGNFA